jgi:hypothetical protein
MRKWQCRVAPSLGGLEGEHHEVWGTEPYLDNTKPTAFFGVYGLPDFYALWSHKGEKAILWAGSDIRHFEKGYWLEDGGGISVDNKGMAAWINKYCQNYVENQVEYNALKRLGIESEIVPSFMGNTDDFQPCFKSNVGYPHVFTSVSGDDFELYGWDKINDLAEDNPEITFHMYGNTKEWIGPENMVVHGRVPKEEMNKDIKNMQGCIRMVEFDGFSEIVAKAFLYEQYPISLIPYPHSILPKDIRSLRWKDEPNTSGREWLLSEVNRYPWNENNK